MWRTLLRAVRLVSAACQGRADGADGAGAVGAVVRGRKEIGEEEGGTGVQTQEVYPADSRLIVKEALCR